MKKNFQKKHLEWYVEFVINQANLSKIGYQQKIKYKIYISYISLKRRNSSPSLKRSGSAPNLINTTDKFSPLKRGSSIYYDEDDDWSDDWKTPPNVVYKKSNIINKPSINPIKPFKLALKGHAGIFKEFGKIGNAFGQFIPRRKRTGQRSKKKKKKNNKKTKKKNKKRVKKTRVKRKKYKKSKTRKSKK